MRSRNNPNIEETPDVNSVRIVSEADARIHQINKEGFLEPLLKEWDPRRSKMRRSEFPKVYQPFNLEVFRHSGWAERGALFIGRKSTQSFVQGSLNSMSTTRMALTSSNR